MTLTLSRNIVRLENRKYVEHWQYSQGYFEWTETDDIFNAANISFNNLATYFDKPEFTHMTVDFEAKIVLEGRLIAE